MTQVSQLPDIGTRLVHSGYLGTVRFVGPVDGTQGIWLGVEWDDPKRGKHDGVKDGRRYFVCTVPGAGSFIRHSPAVSYGVSFCDALISKYTEQPHSSSVEKVVLGSSNGTIEVEAVGLNKIRAHLSRLEALREVSLDGECISHPDPPGKILSTCPGIRGLDLTKNLLPSWDTVALIVAELPQLRSLTLNQNRLALPRDTQRFCAAFSAISELQLNATLTTWTALKGLIRHMPSLKTVETGYNLLKQLESDESELASTSLHSINFDGNELRDWSQVMNALRLFPSLQRVILSSNRIDQIDAPREDTALAQVKHSSLASNALKSWSSIDNLRPWFPGLESLNLSGNPLVEDPELGKNARQFIIAKIPTLKALDSATITTKERDDCELFYLSFVNKHGPRDEATRLREHPRWSELCNKHGKPDLPPSLQAADKQNTLGNRLLHISVHRCPQPPAISIPNPSQTQLLRVLPSMALRAFRMKVAKSFAIPRAEQGAMKLWLKMPDGTFAELDSTDTHDLSWLGFENGSEVLFCVEDQ